MKFFVCLVFSYLVFSGNAHAQSQIRITTGEWEPFLSSYSHEYGFSNHIVTEAFRNVGIDVVWGFFPWKRSYELAKKGSDWDASSVWWATDKSGVDFLLSDTVSTTSFVWFHLKSEPFVWEQFGDLKNYRIGLTRGYHYGRNFEKAQKAYDLQVSEASKDEQLFKMLLKGRIQIFPNDPLVGAAQIRNNFSREDAALFTFHPKNFEISTLHLVVSKNIENGPELVEKFNRGLKILRESGRLAEIYRDLEAGIYDKKATKFKK
ncbi:MAG: ABC transporter substrate-binding protein [Pseudomonas marincola]